jgi:hypothetical protein
MRAGSFVANSFCGRCGAFALLFATFAAAPAQAVPVINKVTPRSLAVGGTTTLTIEGADLAPNPRLVLPVAIERQEVKPGGGANRVQIEVKLPSNIVAGIRPLRIASDLGISGPTAVAIDELVTMPFSSSVSNLPAALEGELTGGTVLRTSFRGAKGQSFVAEIESRRLGSALNPILRLLNARGVQIAFAADDAVLSDDARLDTVLPADGEYTLELHDALFRGAAPGAIRLKMGGLRYGDLTYPLAVQQGASARLDLVRTNASQRLTLDAAGLTVGPQLALQHGGSFAAGSPMLATSPRVLISDHVEVVESTPPATGPHTAPPVGVSGRLSAPGEEDRHHIPVTPGVPLRFDVLADRVGSPVDAVLSIRNEQGQQLAGADDRPGTTDPVVDFTPGAGANALVVSIRDLHGRGGRDFVYRVSIKPTSHPDFGLALPQDTIHVPRGGRTAVRCQTARQGHAGAILLAATGLPTGVSIANRDVAAGAEAAIVVFEAKSDAKGQSLAEIQGRSGEHAAPRRALAPESPSSRARPWERALLGVAAGSAGPLSIDWGTQLRDQAVRDRRWTATVRATRASGVTGPIRLSLLTTQTIPKKNQNNQQVDDLARALRLAEAVTIGADKIEAAIEVIVPADLPMIGYDLVVQADLLSADGKQTIGTTYTRPHRVTIVPPPKPPEPQ